MSLEIINEKDINIEKYNQWYKTQLEKGSNLFFC